MDTLLQDLRYAVRTLLRSPGFTLVAALTLALGIGANTAIFSVVNAALLRSLPYPDPDRLVQVWQDSPSRGIASFPFSPGDFADLRSQARTLSGVAAIQSSSFNLTGDGEPVRVGAARVSASFFDVLGRRPTLGRGFAAAEEREGADHVAVIGQGLWKQRFGGDRRVVGRTLLLNGERYTIVGVVSTGVAIPRDVELWVPWALTAQDLANHGGHYATVVGRLAPGATMERAWQELSAVGARIAAQHPDTNTGFGMHLVPLRDELVRQVRPALLVLFAAVGLLLLIACANVSNLLLARAASRSREIAVRAALGAGRWRLVRQLLVESVVLGLAGGAAGLLLAAWGVGLIVRAAGDALRLPTAVSIDGGVLAFTFAVAVLTGVLFGLVPALHASRLDLHETLKEGGRSGTGDARRARSRALLVVAETALAMVLLVGAGLLVKSFATLAGTDPGFRVEHVLTGSIDLPQAAYGTPERQAAFFRALDERAAAIPGVRSAGAATTLPLSGATARIGFHVVGTPPAAPGEQTATGYDVVTPGYFEAIGIPLRRGRTFTARDDAHAPGAVVINEAMARRYFAGQDPIGRRMTLTDSDTMPREVVGVVGDVRHEGLGEEPSPAVYVSQLQAPVPFMRYVLRTAGDPARAAAALRREVAALDGRVAVGEVRTMAQVVADSVASPRLSMVLLGIFAALGIVLAAIGLYGVVSYSVASRSQEIGIRMAMGARPKDVVRMVVRQGVGMTAGGLVLGLLGAFAATRLLRSMLVGVSATDPAVFAAVPLLLMAVALAATWLPGRRATRLDPMAALRQE
jgi:putative ABC transport system permease protein